MVIYQIALGRPGMSLSSAQAEFTDFFNELDALLAGAICLISPALTATAIVAERQRQSLDLVLSAPIDPKYLLVGKMISSYRYTWMLLILALPVVAMSVVLGGATWRDVFGCFLLLSFHALIFTSMALFISTLTTKPASAVIWSFFAVGGYVVLSGYLAATSAIPMAFSRGGTEHLPFTISLSPFTVLQAINSSTLVGSIDVPNWVFAGIISLLLSRLFLLGAAVNLAPLDRRLSANLRLSGLAYTFGLGCLVMYSLAPVLITGPAARSLGGPGQAGLLPDLLIMIVGIGSIGWVSIGVPMLSCYGWEGSKRFWPNGQFSPRHTFDGTPAGNLPFLLLLLCSGVGGSYFGYNWAGGQPTEGSLLPGMLWAVGIVVLTWSMGQLLAAACKTMKTARVLHLCSLISLYLGLPLGMMIFQVAPSWVVDQYSTGSKSDLWYLWPLTPLLDRNLFHLAPVYGLIMLVLGGVIALWARSVEAKRSRRIVVD